MPLILSDIRDVNGLNLDLLGWLDSVVSPLVELWSGDLVVDNVEMGSGVVTGIVVDVVLVNNSSGGNVPSRICTAEFDSLDSQVVE